MEPTYCCLEECDNLAPAEDMMCPECEAYEKSIRAEVERDYISRYQRGACCGGTNRDTKCGQCGRHVGYDTNKPGRVA